jgi:glycosyltransferase involved in cell wall biosynthesis
MPDRPLVYVHALAPPTPGGTPVILHRVLSGPPDLDLETFTDLYIRFVGRWTDRPGPTLPGRYHYFLKLPPWGGRWRLGRIAIGALNYALAWAAGAWAALVARRRRAGWVLSVADRGFSVIAGDAAARLAGVPHLVWVFDLWEENAYTDVERWIASRLEGGIWRRAAAIISHTEAMSDYYERKHGVRCRVLATPIDVADDPPPDAAGPNGRTPREVLYAGALYWAQEETLRRLARVCRDLEDVTLTVLGDEAHYRAHGIEADRYEPPLAAGEFRGRLARADLLFLGLSFNSAHPEIVATATPARLPEFMASGRPLVVHAPAGAHVTEYARREDFAEVVDEPDDEALATAIRHVLADERLTSMRARRARELALERHETAHVRRAFRDLLADTMHTSTPNHGTPSR